MNEAITELNPAVVTLISAFIPLVLAMLNRYNWPKEAKALISFVITIAIGFGIAWLSDVHSFEGIAATCAAVYALSQAAYFGVYRPTGAAEKIEKSTG